MDTIALDKVYKKVFGGKCGPMRYGEKTEEFQLGITTSLWEINKFATLGRTQRYISEKVKDEEWNVLPLEIYKKDNPGWSITDESDYYFFFGPKYVYKVRSCWIYNLAEKIKEVIDTPSDIRKWIQKVNKYGTKTFTINILFGVPCLPTSFEVEVSVDKRNGLDVVVNVDWKLCVNKLKMDIEKIKRS